MSTGEQQVPGGQGLDLAVGRGGVADIPGFVSISPAHDQVDELGFPKPPSPRNCQGQVRVLRDARHEHCDTYREHGYGGPLPAASDRIVSMRRGGGPCRVRAWVPVTTAGDRAGCCRQSRVRISSDTRVIISAYLFRKIER